jgi:hypothetical protein
MFFLHIVKGTFVGTDEHFLCGLITFFPIAFRKIGSGNWGYEGLENCALEDSFGNHFSAYCYFSIEKIL